MKQHINRPGDPTSSASPASKHASQVRKRVPPTLAKSARHRIEIKWRAPADLQLNPLNPRVHSKPHIRQIAESIRTHGFVIPITVDVHGTVICGHGRLLAARLLDLREVPTVVAADLSSAEQRVLAIADNKLTENGRWHDQLLGETFRDLSELDLDFSLEITGFSMAEIDLRIEGLNAESETNAFDTLPETDVVTVSQAGDLWFAGQHRVLHDDSTRQQALALLMGRLKASAVIIDPPYNVRINGHVSGLGATQHREFAYASGEMSKEEFEAFLLTVLTLLRDFSKDGSLHYVAMDWRHMHELLNAGLQVYREVKNIAVWVKDMAGMGSFYRSQHELWTIFKHGKAAHRNNIELGRHGRSRSNVWEYPGVNSLARKTDEGRLGKLHPTVKPVQLVADAILDCTVRGEIVLDTFLGSGTTLIAAERVGRRCFGMEIDATYVDLILKRWQTHTGQAVRHAVTGQTFDEIAAERSASHAS